MKIMVTASTVRLPTQENPFVSPTAEPPSPNTIKPVTAPAGPNALTGVQFGSTPIAPRAKARFIGIDAARGLALIGIFGLHLNDIYNPETYEVTWSWFAFNGRATALFAMLAGVGLAFTSGGRKPHTGREMTATRIGMVVRAALIMGIGLSINQFIPDPAPGYNILFYYGVFFLLAIPLLHLRRRTLAALVAVFAVLGPVLVHVLGPSLPQQVSPNPTFTDVLTEPGRALAQLLLTGTYPAVAYMTYVCAGVLVGRLDLREITVQFLLAAIGLTLAVGSWFVYWSTVLYYGGYEQLLRLTPGMTEEQIYDITVWGPETTLPTSTWWWLLIPGPHTNTPIRLLMDLGAALAALGVFLLVVQRANWLWTTLAAMGARTLTLYSAHLLGLSLMLHYDAPGLWYAVHVAVAAVFALLWQKWFGQGPLERLVTAAVRVTRRAVLAMPSRTADTPGG
jgi:uncharacterized membrane protein YeiB